MKRKILYTHVTAAGVTIRVVRGDLTLEPVDAIVNAANNQLVHGGGVAAAIVRAGGPDIQRESDEWVKNNGTVPTGGAVITGAGLLECRNVIHAVGPIWRNRGDEDALLESTVTQALELAKSNQLKSIAMPGISTGIFGFPKERGARVIIRAVLAAVQDGILSVVNFTNIDGETATIFAVTAQQLLG